MARTSTSSAVAVLLARGSLTLPKALRDAHQLTAGIRFTIIDLGGGSLMLVPRRAREDAVVDPLDVALAHLDEQRGRTSEYDTGAA